MSAVRTSKGFTLIELIMVMVILGIILAVGSRFVLHAVDSYRSGEVENKVLGEGRLAMEQMTRYLRASVPNSLRVSASGNCIEFMPAVGGGNYIGSLPDSANGAPLVSSISTSPIVLDLGSARHVVVGALFSSEIYTTAVPAARAGIGAVGSSPLTSISLALPHRFVRNSINKRVFIGDNPKRFCLSGNSLYIYENYGLLTSALNDANPGGSSALLATNVAASGTAFSLSGGSEDRSAVAYISLVFSRAQISATLNQEVLVRNVP